MANYAIFITVFVSLTFIIVSTTSSPISVKRVALNRLSLARKMKLLRRQIAAEKQRIIKEEKDCLEENKNINIENEPGSYRVSERSRRMRRTKLIKKMITSCAPSVRKTCRAMSGRCNVQTIFKRSIQYGEEATQNRVKRSTNKRKRGKGKKRIIVDISCDTCEKVCWNAGSKS